MEHKDLIIQTIFWLLGFMFLFRIPHCKKSSKEIKVYPSVSVIILARNEEMSLPILISSIRYQNFRVEEIIVVVGESEDGTQHVAEKEGAKTILSRPLPKGWIGKPWACYQGAQIAKGDILIFLDADTFLGKNGLKKILDSYLESGGVITIQPFHKIRRLYEQFSGFFNIIGMAGMGTFTLLGNVIKPVGLFGPCIVMSKTTYFESGGHVRVKSEVVEDLALGGTLKKQKTSIFCFGGKGTIYFRMYPGGIRELVEGWSKGFATGAVKTYIPVLLAIVLWIGGSITATQHFIVAIITPSMPSILISGLAYFGYAAQIYWMLFRVGNFGFYTALLYPIPLLFFFAVFLRSLFLIFIQRSVTWKGVSINLKHRGTNK